MITPLTTEWFRRALLTTLKKYRERGCVIADDSSYVLFAVFTNGFRNSPRAREAEQQVSKLVRLGIINNELASPRKREQHTVVMREFTAQYHRSENEMISPNRVSAKEICTQWPKFTESEAGGLKTPESLSAHVAKSYNLPQARAEADVKAWLAGRTF